MLARNGFLIYATMRNPEKGKTLTALAEKENSLLRVVKLDVTDDASKGHDRKHRQTSFNKYCSQLW